MGKKCGSCKRFFQTRSNAIKNYYLGRPCFCYGNPNENAEGCNQYTEDTILEMPYGVVEKWQRDGEEIYPILNWEWASIYEYGFKKAYELLNNPLFQKNCKNCYYSNSRIINKCKNIELCDKYIPDYMRFYQERMFGHLCPDCDKLHCDKRNDDIIPPEHLTWICNDFSPVEKGEEKNGCD
jgi:hypothetical protein